MAISASTITKIICDGVHTPCRTSSELTFAQPQSVAVRLASRAGWFLSEADACPACATTAGLAKTVSFVTNIIKSRRDREAINDGRYKVPGAA